MRSPAPHHGALGSISTVTEPLPSYFRPKSRKFTRDSCAKWYLHPTAITGAEELKRSLHRRGSLLAVTSTQVAALSVIVSFLVTASTAYSSCRKADADAQIAMAAARGRITGPLSVTFAQQPFGTEFGDYIVTASLTMTMEGAERVFVRGVDFEPYLGLAALPPGEGAAAWLDHQPGHTTFWDGGPPLVAFGTVTTPNSSGADKGNSPWLQWRSLGKSSFPDPDGCWVVSPPASHLAEGFSECNVNGAGFYDSGESLIASRQWHVVLEKTSFFGVVVHVRWDHGKEDEGRTPWEYVSTLRLCGREGYRECIEYADGKSAMLGRAPKVETDAGQSGDDLAHAPPSSDAGSSADAAVAAYTSP